MVVVGADIVNAISNWTLHDLAKITKVVKLNGGWEKWAQVELALYINDDYTAIGGPALREVPAYTDAQSKADLYIQKKKPTEKSWIIELKCYNPLFDLQHTGNFVKQMQSDVQKAATRANDWKTDNFMAIGIIVGADIAKVIHGKLSAENTPPNSSWGLLKVVPNTNV